MAPSGVNHLSHPCIYGDFVSSYTERKSGFMKWISKLFKIGSNRGRGGRHLQPSADENMVWPAPVRSLGDRSRGQRENNDLDHAITLPLAEDLKKPKGYEWRSDPDDNCPRALPDSLYSSAHPPNAPAPRRNR